MGTNFPLGLVRGVGDVQRFAVKAALLLLPFVAVFGFPLFALFAGGEFVPVERVVSAQRTHDRLILYGPAYTGVCLCYKLRATLQRQPEVLALGTSRVMQFRSQFFRNKDGFYNAGGGVWVISDFNEFLRRIPAAHQPKLIIMGLDQNFFNDRWIPETNRPLGGYDARNNDDVLGILTYSWRKTYSDARRGKYRLDALIGNLLDPQAIGLSAFVKSNGFRNDGSYYYGSYIRDPANPANPDYHYRATRQLIARGQQRFAYGDTVSVAALRQLDRFLASCRERGIVVVGFLSPYPHQIYSTLMASPQWSYLRLLNAAITPVFQRYDFSFFDFSDLATTGASDAETIDGLHAAEKAYLRLLLQMAQRDAVLRSYTADLPYLQEKLATANNPLEVFDGTAP